MPYSHLQVDAKQREKLHEVADLLLQIYETLAEMRYLCPEGIKRGPHDVSELEETYTKHKLDPAIIYLYSILPYIDETETGPCDFFHGGTFADFRNPGHVGQGRDPFYASPQGDFDAENGQYMRPWATPLSLLGNHGTVIIYDAKRHRIWAIDQEGWSTTDPGLASERQLQGTPYERPKSDWGDDSTGDYEESEGGDISNVSESSSEFWSDGSEGALTEHELLQLGEDQRNEEVDYDEGFELLSSNEQREAAHAVSGQNRNSFEDRIPSRPAGDVLRDIDRWYRELKELPGQGEYSGGEWMEPDVLRPLYLKNGWPDFFDGEAFEVDKARTYCAQRAKYFAEQPLRKAKCYEGWLEYNDRDIDAAKQKLMGAKKGDQEWKAKFELWVVEQRKLRNLEALQKAEKNAEMKCPGGQCQRDEDLPLWEMEMLRVETQWKREGLSRTEDGPAGHPRPNARERNARRDVGIYAKAYKASLGDVERLCLGRTFQTATGLKSLGRKDTKTMIESSKRWIAFSQNELEKLKDWAAKLPEGMEETTKAVDAEVTKAMDAIERSRRDLERQEKWLAEHGNTD